MPDVQAVAGWIGEHVQAVKFFRPRARGCFERGRRVPGGLALFVYIRKMWDLNRCFHY
jgi:hypothetical protein